MLEQLLTPELIETFVSLVAVLLTIGVSRLGHLLSKKVKNDYVGGVIARAIDATTMAVQSIEQEFLSDIRERRADGKLTPQECLDAANWAVKRAREQLGEKGVSELMKVLGVDSDGVDKWISQVVEAAVPLTVKKLGVVSETSP